MKKISKQKKIDAVDALLDNYHPEHLKAGLKEMFRGYIDSDDLKKKTNQEFGEITDIYYFLNRFITALEK